MENEEGNNDIKAKKVNSSSGVKSRLISNDKSGGEKNNLWNHQRKLL